MSQINFPENLQSILPRKPYLKMYFSSPNSENELKLKEAREKGEFFVEFDGKPLSSSIAPRKQAERLISDKKLKGSELVIVLGLGNPYLPKLLHEQMRNGQILLLIDENIEIVSNLWDKFLADILDIPGRHIFAGENSLELFWTYLESLPIERLNGIRFYRNSANINLHPEFYLTIEEKTSKLFSSKMSDLLTKFEFERIWVKNTLVNTIHFLKQTPPRFRINSLANKFPNIPAMLVSAGPSLRKQCEFIKKYRDKVFLFSCDTSLKVLLKFGIIPDGVMTLDAQTNSYFHFMGEDLSKIPLFADLVTSPRLIRSLNFLSVVHSQTAKFQVDASGTPFREATAGGETASKYIGDVGDIQSGGSVATSAFDTLRYMGFNSIYLVGQDLAYTGREIHSTGTHHNEKWLTLVDRKTSLEKINEVVVRKRQTKLIESCSGKEVLTDYVLNIYRNWFEESIKNITLETANINEDGAKIQGMNNISIKTAEKIFDKFETHFYPWKNMAPWTGIKEEIFEENLGDSTKTIFLQELNSLQDTVINIINQEEQNSEEALENLREGLSNTPYLESMIRKTLIYLKRHEKDLDSTRKKELLINSILKELHFLKRAIKTA